MHDVFISYSNVNQYIADAVCSRMEHGGLKCWYAPRDIEGGEDWPAAIMKAVRSARVFVLIYSSHSNQSKQVLREVAAAVESECTIVPFRIDDVPMRENLSYYLSGVHWMEASHIPLTQSVENLYVRVRHLIQQPQMPLQGHPPRQKGQQGNTYRPEQPAQKKRKGWILALAAVLLLLAVVAIVIVSQGEDPDPAPPETQTTPPTQTETEPTVRTVQNIAFQRISHYDDCFYPFSDFRMFSNTMDAYFLENMETGELWLWKTDIDTPIISGIPALPWDPYWMQTLITDNKKTVYFVDELYGRVQSYDAAEEKWRWEAPASLNLTETEYISIIQPRNDTTSKNLDGLVACFLVYDSTEKCYTRVVKLYPDGTVISTDIRHLNLTEYVAVIEKPDVFAAAMLDRNWNVTILELTKAEALTLSRESLLRDYLPHNNSQRRDIFFNRTGRYLCVLTNMNGREYYTVRDLETGKSWEYNFDYADVCFAGEKAFLVFNREDYSLTLYNLENNQAIQLLDEQYFLDNDAFGRLPNIFYYLEDLNVFFFLIGSESGITAVMTDTEGNVLATSGELLSLFDQSNVSFAVENNELFLSIGSQTFGEPFEDEKYGSIYNVIYRASYTYNTRGELIFIQ